jgi:hypothetical protein
LALIIKGTTGKVSIYNADKINKKYALMNKNVFSEHSKNKLVMGSSEKVDKFLNKNRIDLYFSLFAVFRKYIFAR